MEFKALRKNLKKDFTGMKKIRIAIAADWAIQMLSQAVRGYGYEENIDIEIYEAAYDQLESELLDPSSSLYSFSPDYVLIFPCAEKFHHKFQKRGALVSNDPAGEEAGRIRTLCDSIAKNSNAKIILANYCELQDGVYGNYAGSFSESYVYQQRRLNNSIASLVMDNSHIYLLDILSLQNEYGRKNIFDERLYYLSKTVFKLEFLPVIAKEIISIITVIGGKVKKCLITDLDNTLWGGVIGDVGIEGIQIGSVGIGQAFSDLQAWIKELSQRGIAVAVCSKNNEDIAKEPFEKHKEMVLRMEDIAVFVADWEDKASNIRKIQQILNIGFDSMVFIDDNPFERNLVRQILPEVTVPELPEDPAEFLTALQEMKLFETVNISKEDKKRTQLYREEAGRNELKTMATSLDDYLKSLEMKAIVKPFDRFSKPRVAQLSQRSNQFNLRTKRYTEQDVEGMMADSDRYVTFTVDLKDRFGEYGIICVVILEKTSPETMFLDTLLMSCRVLKRSVEEFVFNNLVETCEKTGIRKIVGEYIPTAKNAMVKDLLGEYGFELTDSDESGDTWVLKVENYKIKKTFVEEDNG